MGEVDPQKWGDGHPAIWVHHRSFDYGTYWDGNWDHQFWSVFFSTELGLREIQDGNPPIKWKWYVDLCCRRTQLFVQSKSHPDPYTWNAKEQYCITNVKFKENKEITKLNTQAKKMLPSGDTFGALSPCETTLRFRPVWQQPSIILY